MNRIFKKNARNPSQKKRDKTKGITGEWNKSFSFVISNTCMIKCSNISLYDSIPFSACQLILSALGISSFPLSPPKVYPSHQVPSWTHPSSHDRKIDQGDGGEEDENATIKERVEKKEERTKEECVADRPLFTSPSAQRSLLP